MTGLLEGLETYLQESLFLAVLTVFVGGLLIFYTLCLSRDSYNRGLHREQPGKIPVPGLSPICLAQHAAQRPQRTGRRVSEGAGA